MSGRPQTHGVDVTNLNIERLPFKVRGASQAGEGPSKLKTDTQDGLPDANQTFKVYVNALKQDLEAVEAKLVELQQVINVDGGGTVRFKGLEVSLSATFVVEHASGTAEDDVEYQVKLTCGDNYPPKPPSVVWQACPVEPKLKYQPKLELISSTTNWDVTKSKLADVLAEVKNVIVTEHGKGKKKSEIGSKGKKKSEMGSKGKKKSDRDRKE